MIVTFISQCEKKSLKRTRRILDAFANRIGSNVWQTAITEDGLNTVRQLLRKSATKSTAVSCHRNKTRQLTEVVWIVGNKRKFNEVGVVPVNRTKRNIMQSDWENDWSYASSIQIIATIAALLHDIGKSTKGFQNKLIKGSKFGDPYRHEWLSLKLFELIIKDCSTDSAWLERFLALEDWLKQHDLPKLVATIDQHQVAIQNMPPLAQWVAWLIVTHHRLPPADHVFHSFSSRQRLQNPTLHAKPLYRHSLQQFYSRLTAIDYWVANPKALATMSPTQLNSFWQFGQLVIYSKPWQKSIRRWTKKALNDPTLMHLSKQAADDNNAISDPFLLQLSRLCLMIGDHNYSSLKQEDSRRQRVSPQFHNLAANTDQRQSPPQIKQSLEEHLIGVGNFTAHFCRALPIIASQMPTLKGHDPLVRPTNIERFKWQNNAFNMSVSLQESSRDHGFFGVNMASTGAGKTIGNARIMYGLADPKKGARFTIALGLRVLTLQTGLSFRRDLKLSSSQLAILVGGQANKKLFEMAYDANNGEPSSILSEYLAGAEPSPTFGSESSEALLDEIVDSDIDYRDFEALNLDTVIASPKARDLIFAPIVTCTVDHIIQASECKRGGKFIAPMLRLLSSDVIFDEPDDFDQADLPALSRLLHLAGLMGSRVLLSSATLTPDLVTGLFEAYMEGRKLFNQSQNKPTPHVVCAWFDEQPKAMQSKPCSDIDSFFEAHHRFCEKRARFLAAAPVRRQAEILPFSATYRPNHTALFYQQLGQTLVDGAQHLHQRHHEVQPSGSKAQVSIGLVRIANINNITQLAMQLFKPNNISISDDTVIHVACYHAKQLLILRNALENRLDRILNRSKADLSIFSHAEIKQALTDHPAKNHIFMVLATPVAEVGRDHDYDWAIVEPSSMRSIIQLAGRVWRHRPHKLVKSPNMLLLQYNLRYFKHGGKRPVFTYPGFETLQFKPPSYDLNQIISQNQLNQVDARPRILAAQSKTVMTLSDLEHRVMAHLLNNPKLNHINAYWDSIATANRACTYLQQISPFRDGAPQEDWLLIPKVADGDSDVMAGFDAYYREDVLEKGLTKASLQNKVILPLAFDFGQSQIKPWLVGSLANELRQLQHSGLPQSLRALAISYATVSLDRVEISAPHGWAFHEFFGFVRQ